MKKDKKNQKPKVLFIIRKRLNYGYSYGLVNSCRFIVNALINEGIEAKVVEVVDNNCIDKEVFNYKPTHVIIEALWVVPAKFEVLLPRYPKVNWIVRIHSNIPFIAHEGIAIEWLNEYNRLKLKYKNFDVSANSTKIIDDLKASVGQDLVYLPNVYCPCEEAPKVKPAKNKIVKIGCFGVIRPMKNHLEQAVAAMAWANKNNYEIEFHINASRVEQKGDAVLKNLINLFKGTKHKLVEHDWLSHSQLVGLIKTMDLGMQLSFSETFNLVAADFVDNNIPVVVSPEISWVSKFYQAQATNTPEIIEKLDFAWFNSIYNFQLINKLYLYWYNFKSLEQWLNFLKK